jgi:hypothetical protein
MVGTQKNSNGRRTDLKYNFSNKKWWGEVWYSADAVTNNFIMTHMDDCHPVTYNAKKEDAFIVSTSQIS